MKINKCKKCGEKIPKERIELLPETKTCAKCSKVKTRTIEEVELDGPDRDDIIHASQQDY